MERNPYWDLIVTYDGVDYPLDLNLLTKREELLLARKTGQTRAEFMAGWFRDEPEATLFGVWLAMHRQLGAAAPAYDTVDLVTSSDWVRLADPDAAVAWADQRAQIEQPATDPTQPATPEPTD